MFSLTRTSMHIFELPFPLNEKALFKIYEVIPTCSIEQTLHEHIHIPCTYLY